MIFARTEEDTLPLGAPPSAVASVHAGTWVRAAKSYKVRPALLPSQAEVRDLHRLPRTRRFGEVA